MATSHSLFFTSFFLSDCSVSLYLTVSGHAMSVGHTSVSPSVRSEIRDQLKEEEINIYQFPECDSDEDEEFKKQNEEMKVRREGVEGAGRQKVGVEVKALRRRCMPRRSQRDP